MSYAVESKVDVISTPINSELATSSAVNKTVYMDINHPCTITAIGALITVVTDSSAATITVTRRVTSGSDTNAVAMGTLYIPSGAAAGKIYYNEITPQQANAGDQLKFVFSNHGGSGYWKPWVEAYARAEVKGNNSDFVVSVAP